MHFRELEDANFWNLKPDEIRPYFTLTSRVEASPVTDVEKPLLVFEPQMVSIPAGEFLMGSTPEQVAQAINEGSKKEWVEMELPQHKVYITAYTISRYPVTNREYQVFIVDSNHLPPKSWNGILLPEDEGDHPVVNISWNDAKSYCLWLRDKTGKPYRLPTEAEWEKAARGPDGLIYPWGDDWDPARCNTREGGPGTTTPVGQYSPKGDSPYNCADMAGNVWEWCLDCYNKGIYKNRLKTVEYDPVVVEKGVGRVVRGGSWGYDHLDARSAVRDGNFPIFSSGNLGFRVVLSPIHDFET